MFTAMPIYETYKIVLNKNILSHLLDLNIKILLQYLLKFKNSEQNFHKME